MSTNLPEPPADDPLIDDLPPSQRDDSVRFFFAPTNTPEEADRQAESFIEGMWLAMADRGYFIDVFYGVEEAHRRLAEYKAKYTFEERDAMAEKRQARFDAAEAKALKARRGR